MPPLNEPAWLTWATRIGALLVGRYVAYAAIGAISLVLPFKANPSTTAANFSGIYLRRSTSWIEYYQLTEVGNALSGFYTVLSINVSALGGVRVEQSEVNGAAEHGNASLRQGRGSGIFAGPARTASLTGNGLTILGPSADGGIVSRVYRRVTQEEVNAAVGVLRRRAADFKKQYDESARLNQVRRDYSGAVRSYVSF